MHDRLLKDLRGKVLLIIKAFPEGFNSELYDLCMPGYDFQQSDWVTFSQSNYFREVDKLQQRDTFVYASEADVQVHDLAEWTLLLSRHSDSLDKVD